MPLWLNILILLFAINIILVIVMENRRPADTLAWILLLLFVPIVGLAVYFLFGTRANRHTLISREDLAELKAKVAPLAYKPEGAAGKKQTADIQGDTYETRSRGEGRGSGVEDSSLVRLLEANNEAYLTAGNTMELYTAFADMYTDLKKDIAAATDHIHFQFFKFENDSVGYEVADLLIAKAQEGIEVRVVYDAAACWWVPMRFYNYLRKGGVEVASFNRIFPYLSSFSNYRNHRKVVVIDGRIGYLGGMNIAKRYLEGIHGGVWRDTHCRIVGPAVSEMQVAFLMDWHFAAQELLQEEFYFPIRPGDYGPDGAKIQVVTSNPTDPWRVMSQSLTMMVMQAREYIYLQSPYFIPTGALLTALCCAALSGKDVRVMLPARADRGLLVPKASFSYLDRVLRAGVRVYLYDAGYLHAKTVVMDDEIASIGSVNIDPRSIKLSFEINAFVYDREVACKQREIFEQDMKDCHEVTLETWRQRSRWEKGLESFARLLAPIL